MDFNIDLQDAFKQIFENTLEEVWEMLDRNIKPKIKERVVLLDVRSRMDYDNYRIPCAVSIDNGFNDYVGKKVFVICNRGNASKEYTDMLRENGIEAYSINGGMDEWSRLNYPRWRPLS